MKEKIIYIYPASASFIKKDIELLQKNYEVLSPEYNWINKKKLLLNFVKQFLFLLKNITKVKAVFVMFGGYWSFLPVLFGKLFNKKILVILGGTDCVSFPNYNYGSLRKPLMRWFIKKTYQYADKLLPVDESLVFNEYSYDENAHYKYQGYSYFFKNIKTPFKVIENGFNNNLFKESLQKEKNTFIVLAKAESDQRVRIKGIDKVLFLAEQFPNCNFTIIGLNIVKAGLQNKIPKNVSVFPFLKPIEFIKYLQSHQYVIQLSISEGFPNALCEAMLCNCIPIVSNVGAMPKIIEDSGYLMKSSNNKYLKDEFKKVLNTTSEENLIKAKKARFIIKNKYDISRREALLLQEIQN